MGSLQANDRHGKFEPLKFFVFLNISGVEFLKKYNAWGFVTINKRVPYFALYVGKPESSVLYFGEVESIT